MVEGEPYPYEESRPTRLENLEPNVIQEESNVEYLPPEYSLEHPSYNPLKIELLDHEIQYTEEFNYDEDPDWEEPQSDIGLQNGFKGMYKHFLDAAKMCPGFCTTLEYDARLYLQISYNDVSPGYE